MVVSQPRESALNGRVYFDELTHHWVCFDCKASKATALSAEKSPAVPFLPYAENLKGYIGEDIGFDPLRISDYFPMDYLRESELK